MDPIAVLSVLVKAQGVAEANAQLEALNAKGAAVASSMGKAEKAAGSFGGTAAKTAKNVEGAAASAESMAAKTGGMSKAMLATQGVAAKAGGALTSYGQRVEQAAGKLRGLGLAAGITAGASIDLAVKFQAAMEMIHTQAGAPQKEVDKLRDKVLDLAKVLPQSPEELAKGLFHLESVGLRGAKAMDALKTAAEGAAVGHADLEQTATALGSAWLVNIRGAGDLHHAMAVLNATVGAGNMRMEDLVHALGVGLLPAAKNAGLGLNDVLGALAIFTDEGYRASSAAAQFSTALHFLTTPSPLATRAFEALGMKSSQLAEDMRKPNGLLVALKDLHDRLVAAGKESGKALDIGTATNPRVLPATTPQVRQMQILNQILPGGQGRIMLTLLNQLGRYQSKLKQIAGTSKNFADDVAKTQQTAAFKLKAAWSTVQEVLIRLGSSIMPPLVGVLVTIATAVGKAADAFRALPGPVRQFIGVFVGVLAAVATIAILIVKIKELGAALKLLGLTNPWVLALVALVTLAVMVITHWKQVKAVLQTVWKWISDTATTVWQAMVTAATAAWDFILAHLNVIIPALATLIGGPLGLAIAELVMHWSSVKAFLVGVWQSIASVASSVWGAIYSALTAVWNALKIAAGIAFKAIEYTVIVLTAPIRAIVWGLWIAISAAVQAVWHALSGAASAAWGLIRTIIVNDVRVIRTLLDPIWQAMKAVATTVWKALSGIASTVWGAIKTAITTAANKTADALAATWGLMKGAAKTAWDAIKSAADTAWRAIKTVIVNPVGDAIDAIKKLIGGGKGGGGLIGWLAGAWASITRAVGSFATSMVHAITSAFVGAVNAVIGFVDKIIDVINKIPGAPDIPKIKKIGQSQSGSGAKAPSAQNMHAAGFAKGGVHAGALVKAPLVMMGEEAPAHPEYVIPTNPAYRGRAKMLLASAAHAIGFAQGGYFSKSELEGAWDKAGGPPNLANIMAAIALAESGGYQYAHNPSGASGPWQILGQLVPGNIYDLMVNARNAVAKWRLQGLSAWTTYTNGAYQKYLGGGGGILGSIGHAISGAAGAIGGLLSKGAGFLLNMLPGVGSLPDWLKGTGKYVLGRAGKFIKSEAGNVLGLIGIGGSSGKGPGGVGTFAGVPMANWVIQSLQYAQRKLGYPLHPTSGYRPGFDPHTVNGVSEHSGTRYPHGAVDFGGYHDPAAYAVKMAVVGATRGFKFPLLAPIGFVDDGHASGTGHAKGGILGRTGGLLGGVPFVGSFKSGGPVDRDGLAYVHEGENVLSKDGSAELAAAMRELAAALSSPQADPRLVARAMAEFVLGEKLGNDLPNRSRSAVNPEGVLY